MECLSARRSTECGSSGTRQLKNRIFYSFVRQPMRVKQLPIVVLIACTLSGTGFAQTEAPESAALLSSLLFGNEMAPETALPDAPPKIKKALAKYRARERQFKMPSTKGTKEGPASYSTLKQARLQRAIFSLFDGPDSLQLAKQFTSNVSLLYEWEGMGDSPLSEAKSAKAFLEKNPNSTLVPYLHLFIGHRELCAAEFFGSVESGIPGLSKDANGHLSLAKKTELNLIRALAIDLLARGRCQP